MARLFLGLGFFVVWNCFGAPSPGVHVLALGVEKTSGSSARGASNDVIAFCSALLRTYTSAHVTQLRNEAATKDAFNSWMLQSQDFAEESVVIFYFSGHGVRSRDADHDLHLLLSGGDPNDTNPSSKVSINLRQLLTDLSNIKRATVMIYLDCCYAGLSDNEEQLFGTAFKTRFDCRAFILAAVAQDQEGSSTSTGGFFTSTVLSVFTNASPGSCMTPEGLYKAVKTTLIDEMHLEGVSPKYFPAGNMDECLARLGEPHFYLVVSFDHPPQGELYIRVSTNATHPFSYQKERTFRTSLPKGKHAIHISSMKYEPIDLAVDSAEAADDLLRKNVVLKLRQGFVETASILTDHAVDSVVETAEKTIAMGLPPKVTAALYVEAATTGAQLGKTDDTSRWLRLAFSLQPTNDVLQLVAGTADAAQARALSLPLAELKDQRLSRYAELVGRYDISAALNRVLLARLGDELQSSLAQMAQSIKPERALVEARAAANEVAVTGEPLVIPRKRDLQEVELLTNLNRIEAYSGSSESDKSLRRLEAKKLMISPAWDHNTAAKDVRKTFRSILDR